MNSTTHMSCFTFESVLGFCFDHERWRKRFLALVGCCICAGNRMWSLPVPSLRCRARIGPLQSKQQCEVQRMESSVFPRASNTLCTCVWLCVKLPAGSLGSFCFYTYCGVFGVILLLHLLLGLWGHSAFTLTAESLGSFCFYTYCGVFGVILLLHLLRGLWGHFRL